MLVFQIGPSVEGMAGRAGGGESGVSERVKNMSDEAEEWFQEHPGSLRMGGGAVG